MKDFMQTLEGKTVVLAVTGSIAAVEDIKLARALRRKGVVVQGVMSEAACGIISPDSLTYACGRSAVTKITGMVEHVAFCGINGIADVLLIAPATANTICKIAAGIDDTPVTTFATTAIGRGMPVVIAPAMHESMYRHPAVSDSIKKLKSWGIVFVDPYISENKAKFASNEEIILAVEREAGDKPLSGRKVLVTAGPCREKLDDVRVLTTRSSGRIGAEISLEAYRLGADVTIIHSTKKLPLVRNIATETAGEMREATLKTLKESDFDYYISAAAISDYKPEVYDGKIPSQKDVLVKLTPLPKILDEVLETFRGKVVSFKLGRDSGKLAEGMLEKGVFLVASNMPETMGAESGTYILHKKNSARTVSGSKEEVAKNIWTELI
ncbi:phosphopantothenoylcysteine decarboxylase/phosphopantothenate--cysteine ligase [Methanomicrobium sp. W14]|uniref:bifunctional phosphopantothenoylcysteine decarboxylase/phosphopantothenate--cysteine ligase CoaBC n=1 Tax=Methanomicrobium sp. W14 TaxID=2817839 RepID=UPI001FD8AFEF|nr:bifunctional phosphopantothenoylcysteine decarboxylase/phosphopantothenate--cysteine ligase CoaBC [Methanomicrobium sp. W14]MBP2132238.1 phosphopantothenoylcysteine decarboxylase/phosphopantothenate--cysteine ligase [Methanomicrobium sp. W14]